MNPVEQLVSECEASGIGRRVVLLRSAQPFGPGAALDGAVDALGRHGRARQHQLAPNLLAVWWRGDNPAWPGAVADLPDGTRAELYDLPGDADALMDALPAAERIAPPTPPRGVPLDDEALGAMERGLAGADVSRFARRSPVLRRGETGARLAWEKRFLHLAELTDTLAPGRDALADRTRLRELCRFVDTRMLRLLSNLQELSSAGPFAINLNVASLSGPEFARFDAMLPGRLRGGVVLVLSPDDVLADPAGYAAARDAVRRRDFRIMLRGVTAALLPVLALDRMALDYVGLRWSRELGGLRLQLGGAEAVLGGVDGAAALRWAAREGITLFAGSAPPVRPAHHLDAAANAP